MRAVAVLSLVLSLACQPAGEPQVGPAADCAVVAEWPVRDPAQVLSGPGASADALMDAVVGEWRGTFWSSDHAETWPVTVSVYADEEDPTWSLSAMDGVVCAQTVSLPVVLAIEVPCTLTAVAHTTVDVRAWGNGAVRAAKAIAPRNLLARPDDVSPLEVAGALRDDELSLDLSWATDAGPEGAGGLVVVPEGG